MRYGITFTHNRDLMYVGQRSNGLDITDAVIAWADNAAGPGVGPDVLRFLFTSGTSNEVELARMIGQGRTGIGTSWTNDFAPQRTLDVIRQTNDPQFRITRLRNTSVNSGTNADFQVSEQGNLHIVPRISGGERAYQKV